MEKEQLHAALEGCDLVTMTAGVARKPGMTRDDLFDINAGIVKGALPRRPICPGGGGTILGRVPVDGAWHCIHVQG